MTGRTRIAKLSRRAFGDKRETLYFVVHAGRRNEYLAPGEVPAFEGEEAWFELERVRGQVWTTWKVLRQVAAPK
jgi:hypothetical protein